ncbi:molybdopterin synthase catalytic subunit isoform X2 [Boleophthalmus pectinirostris]|nr:molybdopterin synthase catalytic subunit isoform X2 [Boleophthalmus pectinirostris]
MVQSELSKLSRVIRERWPHVVHICVHHRLGWVAVGEASVVVAISAPHRRDSEDAVQFCVTQLKALVPIWKKEVYDDGQMKWNENAECSWSQKHQNKTRTETKTGPGPGPGPDLNPTPTLSPSHCCSAPPAAQTL